MIWRDIVGYEGYYKISEYGDIFSIKSNKIKKIRVNIRHGYLDIDLYKDGKCKWKRVHRLVAEAFISNPNNLPIVMHIDNNKQNNHYTNLKWGTISENTQQAVDDGLIDNRKFYKLYNELDSVDILGLQNLSKETGYSSSALLTYIKNDSPLLRGKYKGYKIIKND